MKKLTRMIAAGLAAMTLISGASLYADAGSYYRYGDVNNDGLINISDCTIVNSAISKFSSLTGDSNLPVEYAVARPAVYFPDVDTPVPQAADTNQDGYINQQDADDIMSYYAKSGAGVLDQYTGNCGVYFYVP